MKHVHGPNIYDPNCEACRKHGMPTSKKINRHLLAEDDPTYVSEKEKTLPRYGYHTVRINKGVLGEVSKIREELEELEDAEKQGVRILVMCELADLFGAIRVYAKKYGLKMRDLHAMSKLTRNAFEKGQRK